MPTVCYNCNTYLHRMHEAVKCPFCGRRNLTDEEYREHRIQELEKQVRELQYEINQLHKDVLQSKVFG